MTSAVMTLASLGFVQLLGAMSPGPSFLVTARTSVAQSRASGIMVALGLTVGVLCWASAALLGMKILFQQFYWLFVAAKIIGALYLIWIAWKIFSHAAEPVEMPVRETAKLGANPFLVGLITQLSNPKVAVFFGSIFVAMLPSDMPTWMVIALLV